MKRIIFTCGLIAGIIISCVLVYAAVLCYGREDFQGNMVIGYASMLIAFSLIYVGVKKFRDKQNGEIISFGKAFKVGLFITLVASTVYVAVWLVCYYCFVPDFMDKYADHIIRQAKQKGVSQPELSKTIHDMDRYREMYKNPFFVVLLTYMEVLPVGLLVSLVTALLLKRKQRNDVPAAA